MAAYKENTGFTLIELLVVISIIGLLASVMSASLTIAKQKGRNAAVISEVRQVILQLAIYANDHNGNYPNPALPLSSNYYCIGASTCLDQTGATVTNQLAWVGSTRPVASENSFLNIFKPKVANATVYSDGFSNFTTLPDYILYQCTTAINPCPNGWAWIRYNQKSGNTTTWYAIRIGEVGTIGGIAPTPIPT